MTPASNKRFASPKVFKPSRWRRQGHVVVVAMFALALVGAVSTLHAGEPPSSS